MLAEIGNSWPKPSPPFSSNNESNRRNHCGKNEKVSAPKVRDRICEAKLKERCCTAGPGRDTHTTALGHGSPITDLSGSLPVKACNKPLI